MSTGFAQGDLGWSQPPTSTIATSTFATTAGAGRVLHYGADFAPKGELRTGQTRARRGPRHPTRPTCRCTPVTRAARR